MEQFRIDQVTNHSVSLSFNFQANASQDPSPMLRFYGNGSCSCPVQTRDTALRWNVFADGLAADDLVRFEIQVYTMKTVNGTTWATPTVLYNGTFHTLPEPVHLSFSATVHAPCDFKWQLSFTGPRHMKAEIQLGDGEAPGSRLQPRNQEAFQFNFPHGSYPGVACLDGGVAPDMPYHVRAVLVLDNGTRVETPWVVIVSPTDSQSPYSSITSTPTGAGSVRVRFAWNPQAFNTTMPPAFQIQYGLNRSLAMTSTAYSSSDQSFLLTGLRAGQPYNFSVSCYWGPRPRMGGTWSTSNQQSFQA